MSNACLSINESLRTKWLSESENILNTQLLLIKRYIWNILLNKSFKSKDPNEIKVFWINIDLDDITMKWILLYSESFRNIINQEWIVDIRLIEKKLYKKRE